MYFSRILIVLILLMVSCGRTIKEEVSRKINADVIYGLGESDDNRSETTISSVLERNEVSVETAENWLALSRSTAGMVSVYDLEKSDEVYTPAHDLKKLSKHRDLCEGERFLDQKTFPTCSGFLIANDILVTAGHCIDKDNFTRRAWVFGFNNSKNFLSRPEFPESDVYKSIEILYWVKDNTGADMAIVKLDRKVENRRPLKFRKSGKITLDTKLVIIGHPHGLTTKITGGAIVTSNKKNNYFQGNADTSGGNSGSAVFDAETGVVEGILVRGKADWVELDGSDCYSANRVANSLGSESMTRMNHIDLTDYLTESTNSSELNNDGSEVGIELEPTVEEPIEVEPIEPVILPFDPKEMNLNLVRKRRGALGLGKRAITLTIKGDKDYFNQIEKVTYSSEKNLFKIKTLSNSYEAFIYKFRSWKKRINIDVIFHLKDGRKFNRTYKFKF